MSGTNPQMLIRIAADLQELKKNLAEGKAQIETTTAAMGKLASSFNGDKLIQHANNVAAAVTSIGGATKLTGAEQERVNAVLEKALEKYAALGREAPPGMRQLADATRQVETSTLDWKAALGNVAGTLGVAFSAGAVLAFGKSVFDTASNIHDMAERLGVSAEAAQGFKFAAEQAGSSLDAVGVAITKMNKNLAGDDKATVAALAEAGLNFKDIRAMKPEDAFLAIADAIQKIPDPMVQTHVALTVFGKSAAELLPGIKEGFRDAAASADKMSNDTVRDLEAAQDAWGKLTTKVTIYSGQLIAEGMRVLDVWGRMKTDGANYGLGEVKAPTVAAPKLDIGASVPQIHDTEAALKLLSDGLEKEAEAAKKAADAEHRHAEAIQQLKDKFSGAELARKVADLGEAMRGLKPNADFKLLAEDVGALFRQGANLTPEMIRLGIAFGTLTPKIIPAGEALRGLVATIDETPPKIDKVWEELNKPIPYGISNLKEQFAALVVWVPKAEDVVHKFSSTLRDDLFASLQQIPNLLVSSFTGGGGLEGAVKGMGSLLGGTLGKSIGAGIKSLGKFGGPIGEAIGALAGPLMEKIIGMFSSAGRDAVKDFAATFAGGFDGAGGLHEALLKGGDAGEAMWVKITQGTPKGDAAAAARNIAEVKQFLADLADKQKDVGTAATVAGEAQTAAMQKAKDAVSVLDDKIKSLTDSIANEAPEEVMGVIEQQTRAQIDAIKKQRDEAQIALDKVSGDAADAAEDAAAAIDTVLAGRDFRVKIHFDLDGLPTGASIPGGAIPQAEGGDWMVTRPTLFLAGEAGPERATFTPNGAAPASGPVQVTSHIYLDGIKVLEAVATSASRNGLVR